MWAAETTRPLLRRAPYAASTAEVFPSNGIFPELFLNIMMSEPERRIFEFGPFSLDAAEHTLWRAGQPVPLRPKVFDILLALVERPGHLVGKDELIRLIWPEQFVEEGNLNKTVSLLRLALGESRNGGGNADKYIETVPKRGYRFVADVRTVRGDHAKDLASEMYTRPPAGPEEETESGLQEMSSNERTGMPSFRRLPNRS